MEKGSVPASVLTQYGYDSMNRLTMENRNGSTTAYTYDMAGNRTSRLKGDDKEEYRYNSRNQLTELTGAGKRTHYQYDPAGNLTQEQRFIQERSETRKYTYDAYNRNTEVREENFLHKNFYDAEGLRNRIEENGKATDFVYSGDVLYREKEESGTTERCYILGNEYLGHEYSGQDVTFAGEDQKQAYSYITDEQGSLRYILNADRQIEAYQEYSAFGERIVSEGEVRRLGYNSQMEDELTGLTYLRARYYNPATGRFTQEDVIYDDGFNLYAYCDSNPVIYCDPSGFDSNLFCEGKIEGSITAGKNFKDHYIRHKKLLESITGNKYGKFKEDADKFLNDIFNVIKDGKVKFVGNGTLNITMTEPCKIFRGNGITIVLKKNNEFVTLLESGVGMDLKIQFIK